MAKAKRSKLIPLILFLGMLICVSIPFALIKMAFGNEWLIVASYTVSVFMTIQGITTLSWMLYAWEDPLEAEKNKSPKEFLPAKYSFTAIIPARHEEKVIRDTIAAVERIDYPDELKEIVVVCREDDDKTIEQVQKTIGELGKSNISLSLFLDSPINKPHSLNVGLQSANNEIVAVFDAEDDPHPDIYKIVNTVLIKEDVDVVQSGVQLMNYRSRWFSAINVLEYFFWFKSGLRFFAKFGKVTPLGGNTVFFKKNLLIKIGGWDESCLTEDADVAIRLVAQGAKISIVYDEKHVTREETPDSVGSFVRQRTRWNHGYLQILAKSEWLSLPMGRQKAMAIYTLTTPLLQIMYLLYLPLGIWVAWHFKLPVIVSFFSFVPAYVFLLQLAVYTVGIREFAQQFQLKYTIWDSLKVILVFFPYQALLLVSTFRALVRLVLGRNYWEKTYHANKHRTDSPIITSAPIYAG